MKKSIKIILTMAVAFMVLTATGCKKEEEEKPIVFTQEMEPVSLITYKDITPSAVRINKLIYSRLVEKDENFNIKPSIAESWTYLDDLTLQFKIRKDIKFHNGDPLTAYDVKFSIDTLKKTPLMMYILPPLKEVRVIDDYTVNIVTKKPLGPLLLALTHPSISIISQKYFEDNSNNTTLLDKNPIGTGPYKFVSWTNGEIKLERNEEYFGVKPKSKYLISKIVESSADRLKSLQDKTSDIAMTLEAKEEMIASSDANLSTQTKVSTYYNYIGLNQDNTKLADKRVRQAINYAINKQKIIDEVLLGQANIATSPLSSQIFGFNENTKAYPYDLEKAKTLLKEAGYSNGLSFSLTYMTYDEPIARKIADDLSLVGIMVSLNGLSPFNFYKYVSSGKQEMFMQGLAATSSHAYDIFKNVSFGSNYKNTELGDLIKIANETIDPAQQKVYYGKVQELMVAEAIDVMLFYRYALTASQKNIKGLEVDGLTLHDLTKVYRGKDSDK